jgi:hypothetical protein
MTWIYLLLNDETKIPDDYKAASLIDFCVVIVLIMVALP